MNNWIQKEQPSEDFLKEFPEISKIAKIILWQRNLKDQKSIDEFFNPDYSSDLHDPFLLNGSRDAVGRIFKAIDSSEKVMVYGDYDSDGVCGAAILREALLTIGAKEENVGVYLPDREKEGYGLKPGPVEEFIKNKYNLIITVDCGTTSHDAIDLASKNSIDTIVIDHHRVIGNPPKCAAFVNPHQDGEKYPFHDLCGAAVAFKIACALYYEGRKRGITIEEGQEKWMLDLAAIATITDLMPLLGENRAIVKYGLFVLAQTKRAGLKALMEASGVKPTIEHESLTTNINPFTIGFVLGPRLNAAGRMDHANAALMMIMSSDYGEAMDLAKLLNEQNRQRQELVERIVGELEQRISGDSHVIFEGDKTWPIGVVGIVAGRAVEKYYRPAFIYQTKADGTCAGSVRTIPGLNVVKALESVKDLLINFGGHPQAGGFTVSQEKAGEMKEKIEDYAKSVLQEKDFVKNIEYSAELSGDEVSWQSHDEVQNFQPFGEGNRDPVFFLRKVRVMRADVLDKKNGNGNGRKHLKLFLEVEGKQRKAMAFGLGEEGKDLRMGDAIDILFNFAVDEWNGTRDLMLRVVDFRKSS